MVTLDFDSEGTQEWAALTSANVGKQVAIVLDGVVQSFPTINNAITSGQTEISGSFSEKDAKDLALVLRYGALPVRLEELTAQEVSATLGKDQLHAGIWAGLIGLAIVTVYMVAMYRVLGLLVLAGLAVTGLEVWAVIAYLGEKKGLTLTLAGVTGLIVSLGIAVDSFIVYFERLKDELKAGRQHPVVGGARVPQGVADDRRRRPRLAHRRPPAVPARGGGRARVRLLPRVGHVARPAGGVLLHVPDDGDPLAQPPAGPLEALRAGRRPARERAAGGHGAPGSAAGGPPATPPSRSRGGALVSLKSTLSDLVRDQTNFGIIRRSKIYVAVSLTAVVISIVAFAVRDLNLNIDFEGGTSWQVEVPTGDASAGRVRDVVEAAGVADPTVKILRRRRPGARRVARREPRAQPGRGPVAGRLRQGRRRPR